METTAFLILRIVYAAFFLYPIKNFLKNWPNTVNMMSILVPFQKTFFAVLMIAVMVVGALSILLGIYAPVGGILLCAYSLIGVVVHFRLSKMAANNQNEHCKDIAKLAAIGHSTSAQKNFVIAAVGLFFALVGSGPWSIT